jgi:hypothetical protein
MNGDLTPLKPLYEITFILKPLGWAISLTSKNSDEGAAIKINMQGLPEQVANKLEIIMADGDRTEFLLGQTKSGADVKLKAMQLFELLSAN